MSDRQAELRGPRVIHPVLWFMAGGTYGASMVAAIVFDGLAAGAFAVLAIAIAVASALFDPADGWRT